MIITALAAILGTGCAPAYRPVETNRPAPGESESIRRPIESAQAQEIRNTMGALADGYESVEPPVAGPRRGRWADVVEAVSWAVADAEVAVLATDEQPLRWTFELLTLDERPGRLVIDRVGDAAVVWDAQASIGLFPERSENIAAAQRLLKAFADRMAQLSAKPRFADD